MGQQHQLHFGACRKCTVLGSTPDLLNRNLWGRAQESVLKHYLRMCTDHWGGPIMHNWLVEHHMVIDTGK